MVYILADDFDRSTEGVKTVKFSLDGKDYEIDLSPENAKDLRRIIQRYMKHARPIGSEPKAVTANKLLRDWAQSHGHSISSRGKIPAVVIDTFQAAHPNPA